MTHPLEIEFCFTPPVEENVQGIAVYDEQLQTLPEELSSAAQKKRASEVMEIFHSSPAPSQRFVIAKLGKQQDTTPKKREEAGAALFAKALEGTEQLFILDISLLGAEGLDILMGILLSSWNFHKYRTIFKESEKRAIRKVAVVSSTPELLRTQFKQMQAVAEGVLYARSLTSEPPNVFFPMAYAERVKELEAYGIEVEILDSAALHQIGMTALLAVGQASPHSASVAVLKWNGAGNDSPPIALVGKGVCFDSGGLCLKPTAQQYEMKWDKAGAGVVAGTLKTLALAKVPHNVVGIIGLVENMPDGKAMKPGDIIRTLSGQTIEIVNTDAEGRLLLADCLWYAQEKFKPRLLIDFGTLTLETIASLGSVYAGFYSTSSTLSEELKRAGEKSGDWLWELPMGPFFAKQIESPVADMKNAGVDFCGENGAAAEFLKRFVKEGIPWAHIDIAGVSWSKEDLPLSPKGVTGFGVRLMHAWLT